MVIAHKVEEAVNHQEKDFFLGLPTDSHGLALCRFCADDHISQNLGMDCTGIPPRHGKSDDIGGTTAVKILTI
jgi:hypothetical protein